METLREISREGSSAVYSIDAPSPSTVRAYVATTPETRRICNDPFFYGVQYTRALQNACSTVLAALARTGATALTENETTVLNILRGGLNFGLREALADAFEWNTHTAAFISAQRARSEPDPEQWYITESNYRKVFLPKRTAVVFGDVVATGTSLQFGLQSLLDIAHASGSEVKELVFFTIGGPRSEDVLAMADAACRERFAGYSGATVVYFEGRFSVADATTPVMVKISGTDLIRRDSLLAPEFLESQYENPSYPLERCTIYDAGSRSFWLPEYLEDVHDYWKQVHQLARDGVTYAQLVSERLPAVDPVRFGKIDLLALCERQLQKAHLS
ncbi:MAG: hypothetical protein IT290_12260 [Deltaproteobacteria bacterium]|nr:hypothetical protein [Deltaproteobacteria bacterium]